MQYPELSQMKTEGSGSPCPEIFWLGCLEVEGSDEGHMEKWGPDREGGRSPRNPQQTEHYRYVGSLLLNIM